MPERGFFLLADISGFTAFLTATELEHGPAVTADLLDTVARALGPGVELEGLLKGIIAAAVGLLIRKQRRAAFDKLAALLREEQHRAPVAAA